MTAMIDASCPRCGRRFGWAGRMSDQPPCPKCGHRPPQAALERADQQFEDVRRQMLEAEALADGELPAASGHRLREIRMGAGLTLRNAAKRLGMGPVELSRIEQGLETPTPSQRRAMGKLYAGEADD